MRGMNIDVPDTGLPFMKMHGLGNDFVVIDCRSVEWPVTPSLAIGLSDRHRGVGFDQLAVIKAATDTDAALTFYNADGSTSSTCGNATRCIARFLIDETGQESVTLRTDRGVLVCKDAGSGSTSVNMGQPLTEWQAIPLAEAVDTDYLPLDGDPVATSMGNPHCTFFVEEADAIDLAGRGAAMETHPLFPQRTNVQFAHVIGPDHLRMRVWERGVGVTLASGSSSCAVAVAAVRRGLTGRRVTLDLDGGRIAVDWRDDGVWMTGPTAHVFSGTLTPAFLESL